MDIAIAPFPIYDCKWHLLFQKAEEQELSDIVFPAPVIARMQICRMKFSCVR
jgi:hypothetical protein